MHEVRKCRNIEYCTRDEINCLVWIKMGVWKLRDIRRVSKEVCLGSVGSEDVKGRLLSCPETKKCKMQSLCNK
jgi:hypothetical protein